MAPVVTKLGTRPKPSAGDTTTATSTSLRCCPIHAATLPPAEIPSTDTGSPNPRAMSTVRSPNVAVPLLGEPVERAGRCRRSRRARAAAAGRPCSRRRPSTAASADICAGHDPSPCSSTITPLAVPAGSTSREWQSALTSCSAATCPAIAARAATGVVSGAGADTSRPVRDSGRNAITTAAASTSPSTTPSHRRTRLTPAIAASLPAARPRPGRQYTGRRERPRSAVPRSQPLARRPPRLARAATAAAGRHASATSASSARGSRGCGRRTT